VSRNKQIKSIELKRGAQRKIFANLSDVAEFLNVSKYAVTSAHDRRDTINKFQVTITRRAKNECLTCDKQLQNNEDEFCGGCYYKDLTGKSLEESSFIISSEIVPTVRR
jgi:hypothetical protein